MGGGGRCAKSILRSPCWPQSFLKYPKCFKMPVIEVEVLHHQYLTPNCSQLGVSISASRKPREVRAHSACARGMQGLGRRAAGSTLFCPLFSQNLHQLFRRGTRTFPSCAMGCACVSLMGFPIGLGEQDNQEMPRSSPCFSLAASTQPNVRFGTGCAALPSTSNSIRRNKEVEAEDMDSNFAPSVF